MSEKITWTNITVRLGDLKPWADNPKLSTKAQAKRILDSWQKFGQVMTVAVSPSLDVYDGHQRLSVLLTLYGADYVVDARQSSRHLSDEERRAMVLALTNATGSWNWDALSGWKPEELKGWGFDNDTLAVWNNDALNLRTMLVEELDEAAAFGALPNEDRAPFQQMTFTIHDTQAETIREALKASKALGEFGDTENENSNGNALARICELFLGEHGNS